MTDINEQIVNELLTILEKEIGDVLMYECDFNPDDYAGGNIDDAWYGGMKDGSRELANNLFNKILDMRGNPGDL